jgi:small subunit ribosomal protein S12
MTSINELLKTKRKEKKIKKKLNRDLEKCPQKKGIVKKIFEMTPRKPNSALRKVVRVALMSHSERKNVNAYIPGMGHTLIKFSSVLLRGGNRKDLPGVKYILVRNKLDLVGMPGKYRRQSRSRYGVKYDKTQHRKHY